MGLDEAVRRERDFLAALVDLGGEEDGARLVPAALALLVEVTGAIHGHLEVLGDEGRTVRWSADHDGGEDGLFDARRAISQGIIEEAQQEGALVHTACALADRRFHELESVRAGAIEAVLCAPLGSAGAARGAVYLQGAPGGGPFVAMAERNVRRFVRALDPLLERLLAHESAEVPARSHLLSVPGVVARSAPMRELLARLAVIARLDVHLLLLGPSGSGKSLLAQAVHAASPRRHKPMIELNCAALPEALFENELFGAAPGAHSTVPRGGTTGKVLAAEGGTLFLDEVGELGLSVQAKLLQLLHAREYYRLGEGSPRHADIRIVAATHVDLEQAVREGRFRQDLYYRLRVLEARVPGLDERAADLPELARVLSERVARHHDLPPLELSPGAVAAVRAASWPGHVRQLAHALESGAIAAVLARSSRIEAGHLGLSEAEIERSTLEQRLDACRAEAVRGELDRTGWNVVETARALGIARSYLYKLMQRYGLRREP